MSQRTEWIEAGAVHVEYVDHTDSHGNESEGPALVLEANELVAIEGTRPELLELLDRARAAIEREDEQ